MDDARIARNLAAVEAHFHSEGAQEVAVALELVYDMGRVRSVAADVW